MLNWSLDLLESISNQNHLLSASERIILGQDRTTIAPSRTITYNTSFLTQFRWVLKRTFRNLMLNPQTSLAQVGTSSSLELPHFLYSGHKRNCNVSEDISGKEAICFLAVTWMEKKKCWVQSGKQLSLITKSAFGSSSICNLFREQTVLLCRGSSGVTIFTFQQLKETLRKDFLGRERLQHLNKNC